MPLFDTYGYNNPCPTYNELMAFGRRMEKEENDQKVIQADITILLL